MLLMEHWPGSEGGYLTSMHRHGRLFFLSRCLRQHKPVCVSCFWLLFWVICVSVTAKMGFTLFSKDWAAQVWISFTRSSTVPQARAYRSTYIHASLQRRVSAKFCTRTWSQRHNRRVVTHSTIELYLFLAIFFSERRGSSTWAKSSGEKKRHFSAWFSSYLGRGILHHPRGQQFFPPPN